MPFVRLCMDACSLQRYGGPVVKHYPELAEELAQLLLSVVTIIGEWDSKRRMERDTDGSLAAYEWAPYRPLLGTLEMVADALYDTEAALETMEYMGYGGKFIRRILWSLEVRAALHRYAAVVAAVVAIAVFSCASSHTCGKEGVWETQGGVLSGFLL